MYDVFHEYCFFKYSMKHYFFLVCDFFVFRLLYVTSEYVNSNTRKYMIHIQSRVICASVCNIAGICNIFNVYVNMWLGELCFAYSWRDLIRENYNSGVKALTSKLD